MTRAFVLSACAAAAAVFVGADHARAQLVIGNGSRQEPTYVVNLGTIRPSTQFPVPANVADSTSFNLGASIWAMTADDPNRNIYFVDVGPLFAGADPTTNLYRMGYDTLGSAQLVGTVRDRSTGFDITMQGLAINTATGQMFGSHTVGGTPGEGFYELDFRNPVTVGGVPRVNADRRFQIDTTTSEFNFANLDYDPVTNRMYGIDDDDTGGRALYAIDVAGQALTPVVETPRNRRVENDFDGLATGGGKAYFVTDEPGFVYVYDLVNGGSFTDFLSPVQSDSGLFGGAAFAPGLIPEPAAFSLLAPAALALLKRRGRERRLID
jgi:hypothetical protein